MEATCFNSDKLFKFVSSLIIHKLEDRFIFKREQNFLTNNLLAFLFVRHRLPDL